MSSLMEEAFSFRRLKAGDIVDGTIVSVSPTEVLVDVGAKSEGVVSTQELERLGHQGLEGLHVGDQLPVLSSSPRIRTATLSCPFDGRGRERLAPHPEAVRDR